MLDLLQTGKYGLLAHQNLLHTTSNNISNVNTEGYVRQNTNYYTSVIDWGIGESYTRRMYDQYVQRELFRDRGTVGYYDAYISGMDTVDSMLSESSMNIASSLNSYFSALQDAVQDPTSTASRRELLAQLEIMVDRYGTLNANITNELKDVNAKIDDTVTTINDLVYNIYEVNKQINQLPNEQSDQALQLKDKRDQLIYELSEKVDINVTTTQEGDLSLYLGNGQLLVNGDTYATLHSKNDSFDPTKRAVSITFNTEGDEEIVINYKGWGGELGGYLQSTDEIRQSMRQLGQLAVAFADAMNEQNKGGVTLDGKAGQDLITIPDITGTCNNNNYGLTVEFNKGEGSDIRNVDYQVTFNDQNELEIYTVDGEGKKTKLDLDNMPGVVIQEVADNPPVTSATHTDGTHLEINLAGHGITLKFDHSQREMIAAGNSGDTLVFGAQPTLHAAYDIKLNISKPEDFAFASAVKVKPLGHAGTAEATLVGVYGSSSDPADPDSNQFGIYIDANGKPAFGNNAPNYVRYVEDADGSNGRYVVYHVADNDGDGVPDLDDDGNPTGTMTELGSAPASCNGREIFANTNWIVNGPNGQPLADGYPGYDVNFTNGSVVNGSSFAIELNLDGENDNSNGNLLAQLQQEDMVYSSENHRVSFTEGYADLTSALGSAVMSANTDLEASKAKLEQSQNLFSSMAGVSLDEEAANLIRYQQSYSACARIISASQTVFNSLISALM